MSIKPNHPRAIPSNPSTPLVFEGVIDFDSEDGGSALVGDPITKLGETDPDGGIFVRVCSWDQGFCDGARDIPDAHADAEFLLGKKVRITIELI